MKKIGLMSLVVLVRGIQEHVYNTISMVMFINELSWLCVQCLLSLVMLVSKDVYVLINFSSFTETVFMALSVISLFVLRWTRPDMKRPIKVCRSQ